MFERDYRDLAFVPRWGIMPVNHRQSVAEHSFYVTLYALEILEFYRLNGYGLRFFEDTLVHAILHDRSEAFTSDIPGPVKRSVSGKEVFNQFESHMNETIYESDYELTRPAELIVKVADLMDEWAYWQMESRMGNNFNGIVNLRGGILDRLDAAVSKLPLLSHEEKTELTQSFMRGVNKEKTIPKENSDVDAKR